MATRRRFLQTMAAAPAAAARQKPNVLFLLTEDQRKARQRGHGAARLLPARLLRRT
jgi:hypothetical protein